MTYDVVTLGELLIDFTPCGKSEAGQNLFEQNAGGAPANAVGAVVRLGGKGAFIGKVGDDMHGRFLRKTLEEIGVDVRGLVVDPDVFTTLAFVALENGERSFSFARKPGADTQLKAADISDELLRDAFIFHCGSLSLTDEPAREATWYAVKKAKEYGAVISYDPNYRASLWPDEKTAKEQMRSLVPYVDFMKISDEETALLTNEPEPEAAANRLLEQGVSCVAVTLGKDGALVCNKEGVLRVPGKAVTPVDTTGAGDAFWGGMLYCMSRDRIRPEELSLDKAAEYAAFANTVAALCVMKHGGLPSLPSLEETRVCLEGNGHKA